ncbi:hypothetical protein [Nocardioides euryhalodurans]|uniref:DUF4386 family protein n=1 Tax=Nocardioides euryhalodurans TaxID=2518370 RepID=A0A4P7GJQ4_9ACTN|nr:hypothetical protein [Nocardioides euryhalodurans]QBR92268.1 hypothetical protein EXE57_08185 [Nocardioides euryhalodurans]
MTAQLDPSTAAVRIHRRRDLRTFHRVAAAVLLVVPTTAVALGRLFQMPDDSDTMAALATIAADPGDARTFALLGFIGVLTAVPAFLAAARLARRRRPVLTSVALAVNVLAFTGGWALPALDTMYVAAAGLPADQREGAATLIDAMWSQGLAGVSALLMVVGHVVGAILIGLALRGSIPTFGWLALVLSQPGHVIAFVIGAPVADALAWGLMSIGFACCSVAVLRTPDDEWDLPPLPAGSR